MTTSENTRIYLLYYNEDISAFTSDCRIFPLRLNPLTKYCESEAFRIIKNEDIPEHIEYVGFITPSFFRKTGKTLADIQHTGESRTLVAFHKGWRGYETVDYITIAYRAHPYFAPIWSWLMIAMRFNPFKFPYSCNHIYDDSWLTDKETALQFMEMAQNVMKTLDNAPTEIKTLLNADSQYKGTLTKENLLSVFGFPYYTYHSFIMERCIMFFCDVNKIRVV